MFFLSIRVNLCSPCLFFSVTSAAKKSVLISSLDFARDRARDKVNLCLTDPKTAIPVKLKNMCYLVLSTVEWIRGYISLCSRWPPRAGGLIALWLKKVSVNQCLFSPF